MALGKPYYLSRVGGPILRLTQSTQDWSSGHVMDSEMTGKIAGIPESRGDEPSNMLNLNGSEVAAKATAAAAPIEQPAVAAGQPMNGLNLGQIIGIGRKVFGGGDTAPEGRYNVGDTSLQASEAAGVPVPSPIAGDTNVPHTALDSGMSTSTYTPALKDQFTGTGPEAAASAKVPGEISTMQKIGAALEAFAAGAQGRSPTVAPLLVQNAQHEKQLAHAEKVEKNNAHEKFIGQYSIFQNMIENASPENRPKVVESIRKYATDVLGETGSSYVDMMDQYPQVAREGYRAAIGKYPQMADEFATASRVQNTPTNPNAKTEALARVQASPKFLKAKEQRGGQLANEVIRTALQADPTLQEKYSGKGGNLVSQDVFFQDMAKYSKLAKHDDEDQALVMEHLNSEAGNGLMSSLNVIPNKTAQEVQKKKLEGKGAGEIDRLEGIINDPNTTEAVKEKARSDLRIARGYQNKDVASNRLQSKWQHPVQVGNKMYGVDKTDGQYKEIPQAEGAELPGVFTKDAMDTAVNMFLVDGAVPPNLGRGPQGAYNIAQFYNRAAEMLHERGDTAEEGRIRQLSNKANKTALAQLNAQEAKIGAFGKTFDNSMRLVQQASNELDRSGTKFVNNWTQGVLRGTSNATLRQFDVYVQSAVDEWTKLITSATGGGVSAEEHFKRAAEKLSTAQSKEDIMASLDAMKKEALGRHASFPAQKQEILQNMKSSTGMGGKGSAGTPVITDEKSYNALPSGAIYIDPNGQQKRKR